MDGLGLRSIPYADLDAWHLLALRKRLEWLDVARPSQVPPHDGWRLWLFVAGRGAGKTRTAAEHTWFRTAWRRNTRWLVASPTSSDVRDTCFEGESGLLECIPSEFIAKWNRSLAELELKNGSLIKGIPLFEPDRFRGPQWHGAWIDELAAGEKNKVVNAWKNLVLSVRLPGLNAEKVVTTTPKPIPLMRELILREDAVLTSGSTYENVENLEEEFKQEVLKFEGTSYGRQEIYGELLDPEESGIIKRSWFKLWPRDKKLPRFEYVVQSYDTAYGENQTEDFTACVVFGVFRNDPKVDFYNTMVLDSWHDRLGYPKLRKRVFDDFAGARYGETHNAAKPDICLIEQKSSGISLIQDLADNSVPCRGYNPGRLDKHQRLNLVSYIPYNGLVWVPESMKNDGVPRTWADPLISNVCSFPFVEHNDYVDAFGQGLQFLADEGWLKVQNPHIKLAEDAVDYHSLRRKLEQQNPYAR